MGLLLFPAIEIHAAPKTPKNQRTVTGPIHHKWAPFEGAGSYLIKIEIKTGPSTFNTVTNNLRTKSTELKEVLPYGIYRITITPLLKNGSIASPLKSVMKQTPYPTVNPIAPANDKAIFGKGPKPKVSFSWKKSPYIHKYKLVIKNVTDSKTKFYTTIRTQQSIPLLNNKSYKWHVAPHTRITSNKAPKWQSFTLGQSNAKQLDAPTFVKKSLKGAQWSKVENADFYGVVLFEKVDGKWKKIWKEIQKDTKITMKINLSAGIPYRLRIKALSKGYKPSDPLVYDFVGAGEKPGHQDIEPVEDLASKTPIKKETLPEVQIEDEQIPPTQWSSAFDLYYLGESLKAKGLIGKFEGDGVTAGLNVDVNILPEPSANMVYLRLRAGTESFESVSTKKVEGESSETETTLTTKRVYGSVTLAGRSNLSQNFWGMGIEIGSLGLAKFITQNETTGEGNINTEDTIFLGFVAHDRRQYLGGQLKNYILVAPLSSKTRNLIAVRWEIKQAFSLGTFDVALGLSTQYAQATIQQDCSSNLEETCSFPTSTQVTAGGSLGVEKTF